MTNGRPLALDFGLRFVYPQSGAVGAVEGHRLNHIGDSHDARLEQDCVSLLYP